MSAPSRQSPIPEVYILWHPACTIGEQLARSIHGWLRPGNGLGPQVFYRCLKAPEAPAGGLPPSLPGEARASAAASLSSATTRVSNVQILLPLIDANMIADPAWRHWLIQLREPWYSPHRREFMPIALDATAFNAPGTLRELNFLRPAGLPNHLEKELPDDVLQVVARSLLKQLTEALCRFMLSGRYAPVSTDQAPTPETAPKLKIFLSHAKADGVTPARRLRDYIYSQTQLAAFYDENDIAYGSAFAQVLDSDLTARETAALIAVRSARYANRPWCRREFSLFRRPRPDPLPGKARERWSLHPTLVVEALEAGRQSSGIPEFGNSVSIRWDESAKDQEEQIVTTLLRDVMLSAFHSAVGAAIDDHPDRIILNWLPDPTTLLHLERVRLPNPLEIVHPGRGLSGLELDIFWEFFPQIAFRAFEEVLT